MVLGADILLEILSSESDYCFVTFADEPFEDSKTLYNYHVWNCNDDWKGHTDHRIYME